MMRRLYATRVDTRMPYSFVGITLDMRPTPNSLIWWAKDFTEDHVIYYFTICTASGYNDFKQRYKNMSNWIEFDYFNLNKIEE